MPNHTSPTDSIKARNNSDEIIGVIMGTLAVGVPALPALSVFFVIRYYQLDYLLLLDYLYVSPDRFSGGLIGTGIPIIEVIVALVVSYAIIAIIVALTVSVFVGVFYCLSDFLSHQRA
jgi:hypothetical protein